MTMPPLSMYGVAKDADPFPTDPSPTAAMQAKRQKPRVWQGVLARFPRAIKEIARVSEFGTKKHEVPLTDMSYLDIEDAYNTFSDATIRHFLDEAIEGEVNWGDGGVLHAAQAAWDALARLEWLCRERERFAGAALGPNRSERLDRNDHS